MDEVTQTSPIATLHKRIDPLWIALCGIFISYVYLAFPHVAEVIHDAWIQPGGLDMGYIVLIAVMLLGSTRRTRLPSTKQSSELVLSLFFALSFAAILAFEVTGLESLTPVALLALFTCAIGLLFGAGVFLNSARTTALILTCLPVSYLLIPILQRITVVVSTTVTQAWGIDVYIDDVYFELPDGVIEVAGGCSGHKYVVVALAVCLLQLNFMPRSVFGELKLITVGVLLALVANWIRVSSLIIFASYNEVNHPLLLDHDTYGWVIFALTMIVFFWFSSRMFAHPTDDIVTVGAAVRSPQRAIGIVLAALAILALVTKLFPTHADYELFTFANERAPNSYTPHFNGAEARSDTHINGVNVIALSYFGTESDGELVDVQNRLFDETWRSTDAQNLEGWYCEVGERGVMRLAVAHRLYVGSHATTSVVQAKLYEAWSKIRGQATTSIALFAYVEGEGTCAGLERNLRQFDENCALGLGRCVYNSAMLRRSDIDPGQDGK